MAGVFSAAPQPLAPSGPRAGVCCRHVPALSEFYYLFTARRDRRQELAPTPAALALGVAPAPQLRCTYSFLPFFSLLQCHVLYFRKRRQYSRESGSSSSSFFGGPRWILKSLGGTQRR